MKSILYASWQAVDDLSWAETHTHIWLHKSTDNERCGARCPMNFHALNQERPRKMTIRQIRLVVHTDASMTKGVMRMICVSCHMENRYHWSLTFGQVSKTKRIWPIASLIGPFTLSNLRSVLCFTKTWSDRDSALSS